MRRNNYAFRKFGYRRTGRFSRRRYWNNRRRRQYPIYRSMRNITNRTLSRMGNAYDLSAYTPVIDLRTIWSYISIDWSLLNQSADFGQFNDLYSTFIPKYIKIRWVPSIQQNASGYYIPGGNLEPITLNMFDGFSTIRYDGVDNPITPNAGMQYNSFKTWNLARSWQTIVYPRRTQMVAPRQRFSDYADGGANAVVNDNIRGMGRCWMQHKIVWEDSNYNAVPPVPTPEVRRERLSQMGHIYVTFYFWSFDRK